ncbi:MAG TPA: hypothetical protein VMU01_00855 [Rhizomicrobium sp.]|nr:hypothetical protein [Rhizomicrobium sp.]
MFHRRSFLRRSAAAASAPIIMGAGRSGPPIALVLDGSDAVASAPPVLRAAHDLQIALGQAGHTVTRAQVPRLAMGTCILIAAGTSPAGAGAIAAARVAQPSAPESFVLFETALSGKPAVVVSGADARGLVYAVRELADRVRFGAPLRFPKPVVGAPANPVRSVMRQFTSEVYDKPWFWDRAMWPDYLAMLASNRFNRFDLTFGLGYDMLVKVADPYLLFAYPFLLDVPGYDVKVTNLPDAERDRNLAALRFIGEQTAAHGLDFQLGLWMHGYELKDSPDAKYVVTGLTAENHAAYCRDALTALLKAVPAISSVGLRIHGESGVAEGSYDFWKAVFQGAAGAGRRIEIDLHAKGIDNTMIENALTTGMPVNVSPKFAAEHLGLPYHQADIRPSEIPAPGAVGTGLFTLTAGQRSFTRYGYADLMRDDRKYTVRTRVFYGTQRILASGDTQSAAAYGRAFQFCGMTGAELMEPLTFRGRRGSAVPAIARDGYAARKLAAKYDWQKYEYWYRTWGRMMFDPAGDPEDCRRSFGAGARHLEQALASASMILPLITQGISESAACDGYWPEVYYNMPMASEASGDWWDTPKPRTFQNVTALDPQLFSTCSEYAGELMSECSGKYSPLEVAMRLDGLADATSTALNAAGAVKSVPDQRLAIDAEMQALLARFFAAKLRAGVLFAMFEKTRDRATLEASIRFYRTARDHWAKLADRANGAYAADISISDRFTERGQWRDRLALIDADIAGAEAMAATATASQQNDPYLAKAVAAMPAHRDPLPCVHRAPAGFAPGQAVELVIAVREGLSSAKLLYRHVNQGERWNSATMDSQADGWHGSIPAAYTASPFPLQYYFEFRSAPDRAWLCPGFNDDLLNQPYIVLRRA